MCRLSVYSQSAHQHPGWHPYHLCTGFFLQPPHNIALDACTEWNYNGSSTTTYGNYYVHPVSDSSFQISVHMISASGLRWV